MARLPDPYGVRRAPQGVMPSVPNFEVSVGGPAFGGSIRQAVSDVRRSDDAFNSAKAEAMVLQGSVKAEAAVQDGDWRTWGTTYKAQMQSVLDEASKLIADPKERELFKMNGETAMLRGEDRVRGRQKDKEADEGRGALSDLIAGNIDASMGAPETERGAFLGNINGAISAAEAKGFIDAERAAALRRGAAEEYFRRRVGMMTPEEQLDAVGGGDMTDPASLIRRFEGFRNRPYWDVNAHRVGFGSDTYTTADGTVRRVTPDSYVTWEDAQRDLNRRIVEFQGVARDKVGSSWDVLSPEAKAALTSVTYNYGEIPDRLVSAIRSGDNEKIAQAVEGLSGDNDGINAGRRQLEASVIRGAAPSLAGALPVDERVKIANGAIKAMEAERSAAEKVYASGFNDYIGAVGAGASIPSDMAGRYSDEAIRRTVSGQADQEMMIAARNDAVQMGQTASAVKGATPEEIAAIVAQASEAPTVQTNTDLALAPSRAGSNEAILKAVAADQKARETDPAAYVAAYDNPAASAYALIGRGGEAAYADAMLAEQARIGIRTPMILPGQMATQAVASIMEAKPDVRGALVEQMAGQWGQAWPKVLNELKAKGLDAATYHAALVADDPALSERVASLAETPIAELVKGLPDTDVRDLKVTVEDEMADFRAVFEAGDPTGAAARTANELQDVAIGLALQEFRRTGNASAAVDNAVNGLVNDRYEVLDSRGFSAYVPRQFDASRVEDGAREMLTDEALAKIIPFGGDEDADYALRRSRIVNAAKRGTWVTNATGDGLVLMVDVEGRYMPVLSEDGYFGISFADAEKKAPEGWW